MTAAYAPRSVVRRPQAVRFPSPAHRRRRALAVRARTARIRAVAYLLGEIVVLATATGFLTHRLAGG